MKPNEAKLLQLLSNNDVTFFIPPYQRNYEWTDEQCRVFLDDVVNTCEQNLQGKVVEHFFGTVTYFQNEAVFGQPNRIVLIDGQQRITTTMLFLVALRDIMSDPAGKTFIDGKYLKNNNVHGDSEYKIKLKQVETDWVAYKNIILSDQLSNEEKNSAVYRNYRFFMSKLEEYKAGGRDLGALVEKGLNKFSVITVELEPNKNKWENPQEIFESMNSIGKPLSLSDLVRNYLLLGLDADTQDFLYSQYWMKIEKMIPGKISGYIRDYMQAHEMRPFSKASEANYKELYGLFKKIFNGQDSKMLLKDLSESAALYASILPGGSTGEKKIDKLIQDIGGANATTAYSFLLALLRTWKQGGFSSQDIAEILEAFRIYCLRRRLISLSKAENKNFPMLVNHIPELQTAQDKKQKMFEILSNQESNLRLPNDIEILRTLETMNFYNFRYCKFFLSLVEEQLTKSRPDSSDEHLQIEHIMPQKLNNEWELELGEDYEMVHQEYVHTIGNLTLIRHNQELGQKKFSDKKEIYINNAGLQIAKTRITDQKHWNKRAIKSRAGWMIKYILSDVLPIPDKMRKVNNFAAKDGKRLSFQDLQLIGLDISFIDDPSIRAHVIGDRDVEFEGKKWKLSPLTREIQTRRGKVTPSGAYQGAIYWEYDGIKLADIM